MAITFPLSLPSNTNFATATIRRMPIVGLTASPYTGSQQAVVYPGQWWEMDLVLPILTAAESASWEAFLGKLNGREGTFLLGDQGRPTARGSCASAPGTPVVNGSHAAQAQNLSISGAPNSATNYIREGDYIQIGTGSASRLHQALEDGSTNGSGQVTIAVWPRIRTTLSNGTAITFSSPKGVFRLMENSIGIEKSPGFSQISFSAMEAF